MCTFSVTTTPIKIQDTFSPPKFPVSHYSRQPPPPPHPLVTTHLCTFPICLCLAVLEIELRGREPWASGSLWLARPLEIQPGCISADCQCWRGVVVSSRKPARCPVKGVWLGSRGLGFEYPFSAACNHLLTLGKYGPQCLIQKTWVQVRVVVAPSWLSKSEIQGGSESPEREARGMVRALGLFSNHPYHCL